MSIVPDLLQEPLESAVKFQKIITSLHILCNSFHMQGLQMTGLILKNTVALQIFMVQKFRENVENHTNVNFCNKNFCSRLVNPCSLWTVQNVCEKNFHDWMFNQKIHKNIVP